MVDENKIYSPETITDQPLPGQEIGIAVSEKSYSPEEIPDNPIPQTVIASEVQGVVRSATGSKVIDEFGLVSSESFLNGSIYRSSGVAVTAGSNYPSTTQITVSVARSSKVLVIACGEFWMVGGATTSGLQLKAGSTVIASAVNVPTEPTIAHITLAGITTVSAGDTLLTLYNNSTDTQEGQAITLSYLVLGK